MLKFIPPALLLMGLTSCSTINNKTTVNDPTKITDIFLAGTTEIEGVPDSKTRYGQFREPGIVTMASGRLVVVTQARDHSQWPDRSGQDIVARWSDDNGDTWSKTVIAAEHGDFSSNPNAVVYDEITDALHVLYNVHEWDYKVGIKGWKKLRQEQPNRREFCRQFHISSKDGGQTWSQPKDISHVFKTDGGLVVFGSGRGIQLQHGKHKGRLIIPGGVRFPTWQNQAFISDDHGKTWRMGKSANRHNVHKNNVRNELKIAERPDGVLVMNCRSMPKRVRAFSHDAGETWSALELDPQLPLSSSNASLLSCKDPKTGKDYILFGGPSGPGRKNGIIYLSQDGGQTWPYKRILVKDTVAYSTMTQLKDGRIAFVFENEVYHRGSYKHLKMVRFNIADILGHKDEIIKNNIDPDAGTYSNQHK